MSLKSFKWDIQRIKSWFSKNTPTSLKIIEHQNGYGLPLIENALDFVIPEELKELYTVIGGQPVNHFDNSVAKGFYLRDFRLLMPDEIALKYTHMCRIFFVIAPDKNLSYTDNGVQSVWWSKYWIPFAADGCGDFICIDTRPIDVGQAGRIIEFCHDDFRREIIASSLHRFFTDYADGLESGKYIYDHEYGVVVRRYR